MSRLSSKYDFLPEMTKKLIFGRFWPFFASHTPHNAGKGRKWSSFSHFITVLCYQQRKCLFLSISANFIQKNAFFDIFWQFLVVFHPKNANTGSKCAFPVKFISPRLYYTQNTSCFIGFFIFFHFFSLVFGRNQDSLKFDHFWHFGVLYGSLLTPTWQATQRHILFSISINNNHLMSRLSSNFDFLPEMTKKLIFGCFWPFFCLSHPPQQR